jgi:hypothetical protein
MLPQQLPNCPGVSILIGIDATFMVFVQANVNLYRYDTISYMINKENV